MQRVKIKQVADFIRTHDKTDTVYHHSGNNLRNYVHRKLRNGSLYFFFEGNEITGFVEYHRFTDIDSLIKTVVRRTEMPLKGSGRLIWVSGGLITKRGVLKRNLRAFVRSLGIIDNVYWYKIKNKILLCKLRR